MKCKVIPWTRKIAAFGNLLQIIYSAGSAKKGKACKQAVELLIRIPEATQRERDLLRAVPETEMVPSMLVGNSLLCIASGSS
jgi:hypothetical protein